MNDEYLGMLHSDDMEDSDATLCGFLFASMLRLTQNEEAVDCPDCLAILTQSGEQGL